MTAHVPDHWISSIGPSNWFELSHPPGWKSETDDNILHLTSSDRRISLTLYGIWLDESVDRLEDHSLLLEEIFPVRRKVEALEPLDIPQENMGVQGEAVLGPETPWWKRAVSPQEWRRWRVRAIKCQSLCVMVIYLQDDEFDPEADTLIRLIMKSIEFADPLADPPSLFAQRVLAIAQAEYPDHNCELDDELQLHFGASTINLFNVYRSYANAPEKFDEIAQSALDMLQEVQNWGASRLNPSLDAVRERIMPMLYPCSVWKKQFEDFAAQPWIADLMILYVVDEEETYWYIRNDQLDHWEITIDELHDYSMTNLENYFADKQMEMMHSGDPEGPQLLMPNRPDAYNTSRLLSDSFHMSLQDVLGREFIVGAPNRDFFVAVSLSSGELLDQIRRKVSDDFERMDHPLTRKLLLVSTDGVSEFFEDDTIE